MEGLIVVVAIALIAVPFISLGLALAGFFRGQRLTDEISKLASRVQELERRRAQSPQTDQRALLPESRAQTPEDAAPKVAVVPLEFPAQRPQQKTGGPAFAAPTADLADPTDPPPIPEKRTPIQLDPAIPPRRIDWEALMGGKLFAWIGGLCLFLGLAFFVRYSFEHDLISPAMRVILGAIAGAALLVSGWFVKGRTYEVTSQTLCATGILTLYACVFASSHAFYGFFSMPVAFALMVAVTATAFFVAVRLNGQVVAILGLAGGFLTPVLLSTGRDQALALFTYIAVLDIGLVAVALRQRWRHLVLLAAVATVVMQIGWIVEHFTAAKVFTAMTIFLSFEILFCAVFWWSNRAVAGERWSLFSAVIVATTTMLFAIVFFSYEELAGRPALVLSHVLVADLCLLFIPLISSECRRVLEIATALTFALLASYTLGCLTEERLYATLPFYALFGIIHVAGPILSRRLRPFAAGQEECGSDLLSRLMPPNFPQPETLLSVCAGILPFMLLVMSIGRLGHVPNPSPVFLVALVLGAMLLFIALKQGLPVLGAVALGGVFLVESSWFNLHFSSASPITPLAWFLLFNCLFTAFPFALRGAPRRAPVAWATSALSGVLHYFLIYGAIDRTWSLSVIGLVPTLMAVPPLLILFHLTKVFPDSADPNRDSILAWTGGAALFFITLIAPVQFDREWLTVAWALEGAALLWLFHRVPSIGLKITGIALLAVVFVRLTLNPAVFDYHPRSGLPILNWYLWVYGLASASHFVAGCLLNPPRNRLFGRRVQPLAFAGAVVLAFYLLNIEIADFFSSGSRISLDFSANFARDMTYSIAWALFAFPLLLAGFLRQLPASRYAGLALMSVTLLKLFLHDLGQLNQLYRIGAFIGVAVIVIAASVLYQRFIPEPKSHSTSDDA